MNAQDVDVVGQVIQHALGVHRAALEALIEARRAECLTAEQAAELAREQVDAAEERLREVLAHSTSQAVLAMQHAAAAELARSQDLLLRRLHTADTLAAQVRDLCEQLQAAAPKSAYDVACARGFAGSEVQWLASLKGDSPEPAAVVDALMRTHAQQLTGKPGDNGLHGAGIDAPVWAPGITREGTLVQAYLGQFYRAIRDTSEEPYGSKDWERVGTMGFHLAAPFAEGVHYALGDLVMRDYSTFMVDGAGQMHLFAARGPAGKEGNPGKAKNGEPGKPGSNGRDGYGVEDFQLQGRTLALLARNAKGEMQALQVDLLPLIEGYVDAIEQHVFERLKKEMQT